MTALCIKTLALGNFRCFQALSVQLESDVTVFFAENGGGKTAVLMALGFALAALHPRPPKLLGALSKERDARQIRGAGGKREPAGDCIFLCTGTIGAAQSVTWGRSTSAGRGRGTVATEGAFEAITDVQKPGERWPFLGFYGTGRFANEHKVGAKAQQFQDRFDGYLGSLDPSTTDAPLLDWLKAEAFGDIVRRGRSEKERFLDKGVYDAMKRATSDVADLWYDPALESPVARFANGSEATWSELSDGYHVVLALVGDIARRAVILNAMDGQEAPLLVEGVVLIDEVDLHLHPSWQRVVLKGLVAAFPKIQFVVTTHSPQVLSSVENRQVRRLVNWKVDDAPVFVEGRDTNAILRGPMGMEDRDESGKALLRELYALIDDRKLGDARERLAHLKSLWTDLDPEVIRAEGLLDDAIAEREG